MNNKDKLNNAFNQIHAPEDLKERTFEKMTKSKRSFIPLKIISVAAVFLIVFTIGFNYLNHDIVEIDQGNMDQIASMGNKNPNLNRFKNMQELMDILEENSNYSYNTIESKSGLIVESTAISESADSANSEEVSRNGTNRALDYSETNNQVANVDEADIVKTDGKNIYYVSNRIVYIVDAKNLEIVSKIKAEINDNDSFSPINIFINDEKLVVLGNYSSYETVVSNTDEEDIYRDRVNINYKNTTNAKVYNLKDIKNPKLEREVSLDGYYNDARMIKDNIYFISLKDIYSYNIEEIKEEEILPTVSDSIAKEQTKSIECTDIAYFPGGSDNSFMLIGGFNINDKNPVKVETIFGASDTVYCSENNLYLTDTIYGEYYTNSKIAIYKFELDDSNILLKAKTEVKGYLNDQFSMDEYEGNLRIAVTVDKSSNLIDELVENFTDIYIEDKTENRLYVLDENLEEIGRINNIAVGERIYAVRFIEKVAYVVTFEQVDPLFVIDLSNPRNPEIKGELKIPGYSSYLHPYDENHIIGIGYNTKDNGYGGVTNTNMKMSMFDVSDLSSPKEMFSIDIGKDWAYSDLLHDHKALFFKKSDSLIGLPYSTYAYGENNYWNFEIFHIDLEKGFERYYNFTHKHDYRTNIKRMIYIEDIVYGLAEQKIMSYDLNTGDLLHELDLENSDIYIDDRNILY